MRPSHRGAEWAYAGGGGSSPVIAGPLIAQTERARTAQAAISRPGTDYPPPTQQTKAARTAMASVSPLESSPSERARCIGVARP